MCKFVNTKDRLPEPGKSGETSKYYYIQTETYGYMLAMYLENRKGYQDWYTSHSSLLIDGVIKWLEHVD